MAKTHKKKQRAEKAKVKLKGTQLSKGLNVTKTEFKVRKIVIRQQQVEEQKFADGIKIVNIKESLNRLKHNSITNKTESLRNLREAIENKQHEVSMQRSAIVQNVAAMCLEVEKEPRRESFRTLSSLLSNTKDEFEISPFFHIISSYLRCAMTHITPAIQEDSLLMLDVLLKYVPQQVAADSSRILQNFLEMISRVRIEGDNSERSLLSHLNQKQTAVKWRSKILKRLQQMLQTLKDYNRKVDTYSDNTKILHKTFKINQRQHYAIKRFVVRGVHVSLFNNTNKIDSDQTNEGTTTLRSYIAHLMPLLLESWIEVRPQSSGMNVQIVLLSDTAETLMLILNIIHSLWSLIHQHDLKVQNNELSNWVKQNYATNFLNTFMQTQQFPYQQVPQNAQKTNKKSKETTNNSCVQHNMYIVELCCLFNSPITDFTIVLDYMIKLVGNVLVKHNFNQEEMQSLAKSLRAILLENATNLITKYKTQIVELLQLTIKAHMGHKFEFVFTEILLLLCEIVESSSLLEKYGEKELFNDFVNQLPDLLLKSVVPERALLAMTRLGKKKHRIFLDALEPKITTVLKNIQRVQVQGSFNAFEGRKQIINLFYWTERSWQNNKTNLEELLKILEENVTDKRLLSYFNFILVSSK